MAKLQCPICKAFTAFTPLTSDYDLVKIKKTDSMPIQENARYSAVTIDLTELVSYAILVCQSCDNRFIAEKVENKWVSVFPIYYEPVHEIIPEPIKSEMNEAKLCCAVGAYRAAITMCETALEAMCRQQKVSNLKSLKEKGIISAKLFSKADQVRRWGNTAKHKLVHDVISHEDAEEIINYFSKILEEVYLEEIEIEDRKRKLGILGLKKDTTPASELSLKEFKNNWANIMNSMKGLGSTGNLDAFMRSACEPTGFIKGVLTIGFYHKFHRDYIEDPKYTTLVEGKLSELYKTPIKIQCVMVERKID